MNRFTPWAFIVAFFLALPAIAQNHVYVCEDVTEAGQPIGTSDAWAIPPGGASLYVLYTNNNKPIKDAELGIKLERKNDAGAYELFDELTVATEVGKSWMFFELPVETDGFYKITMRGAGKDLATTEIEVVLSEEIPDEVMDEITDEHAKGFKLLFGADIDENGMLKNTRRDFKMENGIASVVIFASNEKGLKANKMVIKIADNNNKDAEPLVTELYVVPDETSFYYQHTFVTKGSYTISLLSPSGKLINSGIVTVF